MPRKKPKPKRKFEHALDYNGQCVNCGAEGFKLGMPCPAAKEAETER